MVAGVLLLLLLLLLTQLLLLVVVATPVTYSVPFFPEAECRECNLHNNHRGHCKASGHHEWLINRLIKKVTNQCNHCCFL
jgi:hypothetical protein